MPRTPSVVVIGAGVGGLAAAFALQAVGVKVQVVEAAAKVGGLSQVLTYRGDCVDVGTQFYHSDYHASFGLAKQLGLGDTFRRASGMVRYVLKDGSTFDHNPSSLFLRPLGLRGHLDLYSFYLRYALLGRKFPPYHIAKDIPEYDEKGALELCSGRPNDTFRDFVVYPLSYLANMGTPEQLNVYHFLHQFKLGTFAKYTVCTRGMPSLARAMAQQVAVRLDSPVQRIIIERGRVAGVALRGTEEIIRADHVVVAVPPPATAAVLPDEFSFEREFMNSIVYSPVAMPVLFLDRRLSRDVLFHHLDPRLRPTFLCAIDHAAKAPELVPSGKSVLTCWAGYPHTLELALLPDADVISRALAELKMLFPAISDWVEHAVVVRHAYGIERYPPGSYGRILDFVRRTDSRTGVSFVGSLFGGSSMEASILSAQRAIGKIQREIAAT